MGDYIHGLPECWWMMTSPPPTSEASPRLDVGRGYPALKIYHDDLRRDRPLGDMLNKTEPANPSAVRGHIDTISPCRFIRS